MKGEGGGSQAYEAIDRLIAEGIVRQSENERYQAIGA